MFAGAQYDRDWTWRPCLVSRGAISRTKDTIMSTSVGRLSPHATVTLAGGLGLLNSEAYIALIEAKSFIDRNRTVAKTMSSADVEPGALSVLDCRISSVLRPYQHTWLP